jgi:hypothetical protein
MSDVIHLSSDGSPALPRGRLIFAVDATGSRAATWEVARELQSRMFRAAAPIGKLDMQLVYFGAAACRASKWTSSGEQLAQWMGKVECEAGTTQILRVLQHVLREHAKAPVQALTLIGDAFEEEIDPLSGLAGELGAASVPIYAFLEGRDSTALRAFRLLALRSCGRFFEFNAETPEAIDRLAKQFNAVARLAVGDVASVLAITKG